MAIPGWPLLVTKLLMTTLLYDFVPGTEAKIPMPASPLSAAPLFEERLKKMQLPCKHPA
jgi:hypothetical protein